METSLQEVGHPSFSSSITGAVRVRFAALAHYASADFYDVAMGHPYEPDTPVRHVAEPTTAQQDLLAAVLAALMPIGGGFIVLIGYLWLGAFGVILALAGVGFWVYSWRQRRGQLFPKDLERKTVIGAAVLVGVLGLIFLVAL